jgi:hypothetical protein
MHKLEDVKLSPAEEVFCMFKLGMEGSFMTSLIETIFKGDIINRAKLAKGYPELVEVCNRFNSERGYWEDLVERWNLTYPVRKLYA